MLRGCLPLSQMSTTIIAGSEAQARPDEAEGRPQRVLLPAVSRLLYGLASFIIVVAGMHAAADLVNLVLVSILLALTVAPLLHILMRRGMSRGRATLVSI